MCDQGYVCDTDAEGTTVVAGVVPQVVEKSVQKLIYDGFYSIIDCCTPLQVAARRVGTGHAWDSFSDVLRAIPGLYGSQLDENLQKSWFSGWICSIRLHKENTRICQISRHVLAIIYCLRGSYDRYIRFLCTLWIV